MKKIFTKIFTIVAVFCILYNCQTIAASAFASKITIDEFGDFAQENDDKNSEGQDLELFCGLNELDINKLSINSLYNSKEASYTKFDPSTNTPPPDFYS